MAHGDYRLMGLRTALELAPALSYDDAMPWVRASLRGQIVFARATESGALVTTGGRVEVRYKPHDGRAYQAAERNLKRVEGEGVLPDDTCGPAEAAKPKNNGATEGASESTSGRNESAAASRTRTPGASTAATATSPEDIAKSGAWVVYADGACSGNPGPAGLGIVVMAPDGTSREGYEYLGIGTNNIAELTGILRATQLVPQGVPAVVHTDSKYSIGVLTKGWKAKANQDLIATIKTELRKRGGWKIVYVPGHAGVALNERADALAREAVRSRRSSLPASAT